MNRKLPPIHVGHGTTSGALTVFPVWIDAPTLAGFDWAPSHLRVEEREGSAVVNELVIHNTRPHRMVALEGDLLAGGLQDRMLAGSVVLEPNESRVVEALCVEHGRWSGGRNHEGRGRKGSATVRHGNLSVRDTTAPQHEVWNRIGRYERELGATASSSMLHHLDRIAAEPALQVRHISGQRGIIVGVGGRVIGAELFGSSSGLRVRWQGLLDAAALDARMAPPQPTPSERARSFARKLAAMTFNDGGEAGLARQLRSDGGALRAVGIGMPGAEEIVHLAAFDDAHPLLVKA